MWYRVVFLCAIAVLCSAENLDDMVKNDTNCGEYFDSMYQNENINFVQDMDSSSRLQEWRFEENYDYFGSKMEQLSLIAMSTPLNADLESEINKQINKELFAHYTFLSMGFHFQRDDIDLPNVRQYFKTSAKEEMKHAHMFIEYLLKRGGQLMLNSVKRPCRHHWGEGWMVMEDALVLHKRLLLSLTSLHALAHKKDDPQLADFIATNFFSAQEDRIKQLSSYINTLRRRNVGDYQFDRFFLNDK